jgi:hypothetical protein
MHPEIHQPELPFSYVCSIGSGAVTEGDDVMDRSKLTLKQLAAITDAQ